MKRIFAVVTAAALLASLSGCYKSDWEAEQKKSAALQSELDKVKADLAKASAAAANGENLLKSLKTGTTLVTMVDGKRVQDGIVLTNEGYFVKNGPRVRGVNAVNYTMGALTDGPIAIKREKYPDKPYITGSVKGNKADGEWVWYDTTGKPTNRQIFTNGKQTAVEAASVAKDGKISWKKLDKAASEKFFKDRKDVLASIPEFSWEP